MNLKSINTNLVIAFFASTLLFACSSREDRLNNLAVELNESAAMFNDPNVKSIQAFLVGDSQMNIRVSLRVDGTDPIQGQLFEAILPQMGKLLLSDRSTQSLLKEGANFKVILQDVNDVEIASKVFNQKSITSMEELDNSNSFNEGKVSNNNELNILLNTMNSALPIVDEESGVEIYKINISKKNELVYWAKVDDDLASLLKLEPMKEMMKEEICAQPQMKSVFARVSKYGIRTIKYNYVSTMEESLAEIIITPADLKVF